MENGALHVARGTLGDRNVPQRCQMDPKVRPKVAKGTQNGAKGCKKGAKGSLNEQKVSQMAPTWVQLGSKLDSEIDQNAFWRKGCQKGAETSELQSQIWSQKPLKLG